MMMRSKDIRAISCYASGKQQMLKSYDVLSLGYIILVKNEQLFKIPTLMVLVYKQIFITFCKFIVYLFYKSLDFAI